jgi:hypothetical protein
MVQHLVIGSHPVSEPGQAVREARNNRRNSPSGKTEMPPGRYQLSPCIEIGGGSRGADHLRFRFLLTFPAVVNGEREYDDATTG